MQELEDAGHLKRGAQHATGTQFRGIQLTISDVPMDGAESPKDRESGLSVDQNLKNQVQNPNQTQPPVGTGSVEMTRSEKALAGLAEIDGRLHLSAAEVVSLTPLADEWFDRGADERRFAAVLTLALPESISHPAAFLRRRLNDKMPSVRPVEAPQAAPQVRRHECPECDRPVVSEGRCAGCRVNETTSVETDTRDWRQMARQFGVGALTA
jgi:hypothetical protein